MFGNKKEIKYESKCLELKTLFVETKYKQTTGKDIF